MQDLTNILRNIDSDSCPNYLNFHCHTNCSDGSMNPEELIKQASLRKLQHISVTDHHTVNAYPTMIAWIENQNKLGVITPKLWTGIEITCLLKKCLVHVLGYGFDLHNQSLKVYCQGQSVIGEDLQAANVVKAIHDSGGIAILAHPARYRLSYELLLEEAFRLKFDGAEAWYDYSNSEMWKPSPFVCEKINQKLIDYGLLSTCGTDTHGFSLDGR